MADEELLILFMSRPKINLYKSHIKCNLLTILVSISMSTLLLIFLLRPKTGVQRKNLDDL